MQSQFQWGPNMLAISNLKRTIYASQPLHLRPDMLAITRIALKSRNYDFWPNFAKTDFRWLQAYLVPIERDCKHK